MLRSTDDPSVFSRAARRIRKSTPVLRLWSTSSAKSNVGSEVVPEVAVVEGSARLDYDVLHLVMKASMPENVLPIMHTCRTLYQLGMPVLLQDINYTYVNKRYLLYYHLFQSDASRFIHVKRLRYSMIVHEDIPEPNMFSDFLSYSTHLCELDITYNPSNALDDGVLKQIAALLELRRLHLRNWPQPLLTQLLHAIKVPLTTLGIHRDVEFKLDPTPLDFIPLAVLFQASLTSLEIMACTGVMVLHSLSTTLPNVRALRWRSANVVHASTLAALLPGLQELDVSFALLPAPRMTTPGTRQHALDAQPQWHALQRVGGAYHHLWALGLHGAVAHLTLVLYDAQGDEPRTELAEAVLRALRPTHLVLVLDAPSPALLHSSLASFVYENLRELALRIALPDPLLLRATLEALPAFLERHASQRTAACGWSLRRLRMRLAMTGRPDMGGLWNARCARVKWATLAWVVFTTLPSVAEVSFEVADYHTFLWSRDEWEGEPESTSLFSRSGDTVPDTSFAKWTAQKRKPLYTMFS